MDTGRVYKNSEGDERTIHQMVREEPQWAANRIQCGEEAIEKLGRIGELTKIGEFKTVGEAREYCRLHGLDISTVNEQLFQIAGSLMDARKGQDKITRYACAEAVKKMSPNMFFAGSSALDKEEAQTVIINTETLNWGGGGITYEKNR